VIRSIGWIQVFILGVAFASCSCTAFADDLTVEQINKKAVVEFYEKALNEKDFAAAAPYLGDHYTQHNPTAPDGIEGFKNFINLLKTRFPDSHSEIKKVFAEDDYVILHVHAVREPATAGSAIVDIFRLEKGKIVEHWDVIQSVPDKFANSNGMF
jgi:predicted SnoaL-like aldol condensation-catalyzing enzyme